MKNLWSFIQSQLVNKSQKTLGHRPPQVVKKTLIRPEVVQKTDLIRPQLVNKSHKTLTLSLRRQIVNKTPSLPPQLVNKTLSLQPQMMALDHSRRLYGTDPFPDGSINRDMLQNMIHKISSYKNKRFDEEFLGIILELPMASFVSLKLVQCLHGKAMVMGIDRDERVHERLVDLYAKLKDDFVWPIRGFQSTNPRLLDPAVRHLHRGAKITDFDGFPEMRVVHMINELWCYHNWSYPSYFIEVSFKDVLSRILKRPVVDIVSLKVLQYIHAKAVVTGIYHDKEMQRRLGDLYHIVTLSSIQKMKEDGNIDEDVVKVLKKMWPFTTRNMGY